MARTFLRHTRVKSTDELKGCIRKGIAEFKDLLGRDFGSAAPSHPGGRPTCGARQLRRQRDAGGAAAGQPRLQRNGRFGQIQTQALQARLKAGPGTGVQKAVAKEAVAMAVADPSRGTPICTPGRVGAQVKARHLRHFLGGGAGQGARANRIDADASVLAPGQKGETGLVAERDAATPAGAACGDQNGRGHCWTGVLQQPFTHAPT